MQGQGTVRVWVFGLLCSVAVCQFMSPKGADQLDDPAGEAMPFFAGFPGSSPRFRCPDGWWLVGRRCEDVNECSGQQRPCPGFGTVCRNTVGSFRCQCRRRHEGDPYSFVGCKPDTEICDKFTTRAPTTQSPTLQTTTDAPTVVTLTDAPTETTDSIAGSTTPRNDATTRNTDITFTLPDATTDSTEQTLPTESTRQTGFTIGSTGSGNDATTRSTDITFTLPDTTTASTEQTLPTESTRQTGFTTGSTGSGNDATTRNTDITFTLPDTTTASTEQTLPTESTRQTGPTTGSSTSSENPTTIFINTTSMIPTTTKPAIPPGYSRCLLPTISRGSFFRLYTVQRLSWDNAEARCQADHPHSHLVTIRDQTYNDCLKTWFLFHTNVYYAWVGLRLRGGQFRWTDGTLAAGTFEMWGPDQPFMSAVQQCVRLYSFGGVWETSDCGMELAFFCEIPA